MKRQSNVLMEEPGTQEAHQIAAALATISGPEFLRAILDYKACMDRFGGELYIGTYRQKYREDADGELTRVTPDQPGDWHTLGFAFHFESVAKLTQHLTDSTEEPNEKLNQHLPLEVSNGHEEPDRIAKEAIEQAG